jgi:hypothetical protein
MRLAWLAVSLYLGVALAGVRPRASLAQDADSTAGGASPATRPANDAPTSQPTTAEAADAAPPAGRPPGPPFLDPNWIDGRVFRFDELNFDLGFDSEFRKRRVIQDTGGPWGGRWDQTDEYRKFEETLGARGAGSLLGERFVQYDFAFRTGFSQDYFRETRPGPDQSEYSSGFLLDYDVRANILPAGKVSANVFASHLRDRVPRMFLPSLDRTRERYGGEIFFNDPVLPMRLSYENLFESLEGDDGYNFDDEKNGERTLHYEATFQPSEDHQLRLDYEYQDSREQYSGTDQTYDTTRNYLTLNHVFMFGEDKRSRVDTIARVQEEAGDLARDVYELQSNLRLQHTKELATLYRIQWLRQSYEGVDMRQLRGDLGFDYALDQWLSLAGNVYGYGLDADGGGNDTTEWGGTINLGLRHDWALGRASANLGYTHAQTRVDADSGDGVVLYESATFRDPLPVYLAQQDVRWTSVAVTDAGRTRVYLLGRDYLLFQAGRYTALRRVMTGNIANNQTVLVSYTYRVDTGYDLTRDRFDVRVQNEFKGGLTPYYAATVQGETIDGSRLLDFEPRDINRHRLGVNYKRRKWSAGFEFEYNDDSIDPYKAVHTNFDMILWDKAPHTVGTRGNYSFFRFDGAGDLEARDVSLLDMGLTYRLLLNEKIEGNCTAAYRFEDDTIEGITNGVDISAALNWRIGLFTMSFEIEYNLLDLNTSSDGDFSAWIKLRREIPVITRKQ